MVLVSRTDIAFSYRPFYPTPPTYLLSTRLMQRLLKDPMITMAIEPFFFTCHAASGKPKRDPTRVLFFFAHTRIYFTSIAISINQILHLPFSNSPFCTARHLFY